MKTKIKDSEKQVPIRTKTLVRHNYYFHSDEDFREDWEWGKNKSADTDKGRHLKTIKERNINA